MNNTKTSVKLTLDEMYLISAALNNDAITYRDWADEYIEDKELFSDAIESYRERMALKKKIDEIAELSSKTEV